jgi:hypothetical protein
MIPIVKTKQKKILEKSIEIASGNFIHFLVSPVSSLISVISIELLSN